MDTKTATCLTAPPLIVLSREELVALVPFDEYVDAVADAFRMHAQGSAILPPPMHIPSEGGGFHVKAGQLPIGPGYAAFKVNGNFPGNPQRHGLPTIQGAILLFDASNGSPVALLDSIEITIKRTGAATAVAAHYLARPESRVATIFGCGVQGRIQLEALRHVLDIRQVFLVDNDALAAARFAAEIADQGLDVDVPVKPRKAGLASDVIVTCTSAHQPILHLADVRAGTFIAAIGADNPEKSEIDPALMAKAKVVTDLTEQCCHMGDLNHAIRAGAMQVTDVYAELGDLVSGKKLGRINSHDITLFDGSGVGIQDVAASVRAYALARKCGAGHALALR
jgi:ornithine cyclodeaminase/alanine dehydrogenase-like protein (mu-crystallin family)